LGVEARIKGPICAITVRLTNYLGDHHRSIGTVNVSVFSREAVCDIEHFDQTPSRTGRRKCRNAKIIEGTSNRLSFYRPGYLGKIFSRQQSTVLRHILMD
jgi:hypothetical protein